MSKLEPRAIRIVEQWEKLRRASTGDHFKYCSSLFVDVVFVESLVFDVADFALISGADLSKNMAVRVSQVKPSNSLRRLEKN